MKNYKINIPTGVKDYLRNDTLKFEYIRTKTLEIFNNHGYDLVYTPTFEYLDLYPNVDRTKVYTFLNREGQILSLRSDITSSIARIDYTKNNSLSSRRYAYFQTTFRYPNIYEGKSHEFIQAGIELIGSNNGIYEVIETAVDLLDCLDVKNYSLHLSSLKFINQVLTDFNIDKELIFKILKSKDYVKLLSTLNNEFLYKLLTNIFDINNINLIKNNLISKDSKLYLDELINLYDYFESYNTVFDFSLISYSSYYTDIVFNIYNEKLPEALVDGGEYNSYFSKNYDIDLKAVGFGLNVNLLKDLILYENKDNKYLYYFDNLSYNLKNSWNKELRQKGNILIKCDALSLNDAKEEAKSKGLKLIAYIQNEVKEN